MFQGLQLSVRVAKKSGEEGAKFTSTFSTKGLKEKVRIPFYIICYLGTIQQGRLGDYRIHGPQKNDSARTLYHTWSWKK